MEVALAGSAVADERQRHGVLTAPPGGVGQAGRMHAVGSKRCALGSGPGGRRVITAVPVSAEQSERLHRVDASGHKCHRLSVGREHPVRLPEGQHSANLAGLLAMAGRVDGEAALLGQRGGLRIEPPTEDHLPVSFDQQVRGRRLIAGLFVVRCRPAGVVEESNRRFGGQQAGRQFRHALVWWCSRVRSRRGLALGVHGHGSPNLDTATPQFDY